MTVPPAFSPGELISLHQQGRHPELSEQFLTILRHFDSVSYTHLEPQGRHFVNSFLKHFFSLFTDADYVPTRPHLSEFIRLNPTISNLAAMSSFGTTDSYLNLLLNRPIELGKILALYSARNSRVLDRKAFFDADSVLASLWYGAYADLYRSGLVREGVVERLREHFAYQDDRLDFRLCSLDSYFASTYVGNGSDLLIKPAINRAIARLTASKQVVPSSRSDPRKIAIFSGNWSPVHSVYRIVYGYVKALREAGYHLTFFPLNARKDVDLTLFHEVRLLAFDRDGLPDLEPLRGHSFSVAYYPDVGLTRASIILANIRIAPIQVATLGHSVSTFGSQIDYMISGSDVEIADRLERNYSERLILLPGAGAVHQRPDYTPSGHHKSVAEFVINGPWNAQKVNHEFGLTLTELVRRSTRKLRLRVFASASLSRRNDYLPFVRDLEALIGREAVEVVEPLPYKEYMALMEEGDISLDSYPFGGCNTVADSLFLRKPTVTYEGDQWYNRIGSQMLRLAGLPELVATTRDEYLELALKLIHDDEFRASVQARLERADLDATLFSTSEARFFPEAIANLARIGIEGL